MSVETLVQEFKTDPRNKVFVDFPILLTSAQDETGEPVTGEQLQAVIRDYLNGDLSSDDESIYDGAVAVLGFVARQCFADDPEDDIDYDVEWIENDDGSFTAEVRPS